VSLSLLPVNVVATEGAQRPAAATTVRRLQPSRGLVLVNWGELWHYRELLVTFMWRDIRARYKQTYLGPVWAILKPLISMVLLAAVFGGLAGFTSGQANIPYPLFLYAGLLVWSYFLSALPGAAASLLNNAGIIGKIYFPRLYAPIGQVTAPLVDFLISFVVLIGLFGYYGRWPSWHIVFLPVFILLAVLASLGFGIWLCGISVRYRDVAFTLPFVLQLWFYVTPVLYPVERLPKPYRALVAINPMTAVVDGFRWSLLGITQPNVGVLLVSTGVVFVVLVGGLLVFRRAERTIVDMF
jgi:lipopolysaccharide transport system permease protein